MSGAIPITLTFASVMTEVASFIANPLVIAALTGILALRFAPQIVKTFQKLVANRS